MAGTTQTIEAMVNWSAIAYENPTEAQHKSEAADYLRAAREHVERLDPSLQRTYAIAAISSAIISVSALDEQ